MAIDRVPPQLECVVGLSSGMLGVGTDGFEAGHGAPIRVTLAESDPMSSRLIRSVLREEPGVAFDHIDQTLLIPSIQTHPPDVVILDANSPAIRHAESWESLGVSSPPATILTTYDTRSVSLFSARATDVLEKPFDAERFQRALHLAKSLIVRRRIEDQARVGLHLEAPRQFLSRLAIEAGEKIVLVRTEDIDWMQSSGNQILIHVGKTSYLLRQSMKKVYALLDPSRFLRVHRNAIVNLDHVEEFQLPAIGNMFVKLRSGFCLPLRKSSRPLLRKMLVNTSSVPLDQGKS
jgi:two-component system LytT family response regulator